MFCLGILNSIFKKKIYHITLYETQVKLTLINSLKKEYDVGSNILITIIFVIRARLSNQLQQLVNQTVN